MSHLQMFDLERLSAGEVTTSEQDELDEHLEECAECRAYIEELEADRKELMVILPPKAFTATVVDRHRNDRRTRLDTSPLMFIQPRWLAAAAAAMLVAVGLVGLVLQGSPPENDTSTREVSNDQPSTTQASIAQIVRAASDGRTGVEVRLQGDDQFSDATVDQQLTPGGTLRTDSRTRARLQLSDGTTLVLNHSTEITVDPHQPRRILVSNGELMAEVVPVPAGPAAQFDTPSGRVDVLGTKLLLAATDDLTSVRVTRGHVRLSGGDGQEAEVKAGEEGLLEKDRGISVSSAVDLAGSLAWTELHTAADQVEISATGLGELRARRPGHDEERERPLLLASHSVRVRIQGNIARTEVEEVFRNESNSTLEGIYRFPMPSDARIARLALDVDGQMEDGAFVERGIASKIWTGVIRAATKRNKRRQQEEYIWVPGPWRDPALLEWQRGGRFELRVFPIKAHSERRVIIGYTQTIRPHGKGRRYVYPLAHAADASLKVGQFEVDVRVAGADPSTPAAAHGYEMDTAQRGKATELRMARQNFLPAGDVIVDYALPQPDQELRWWTYAGQAAAEPSQGKRGRSKSQSSPEVRAAHRALSQDTRPFVVFAIRPELPPRTDGQHQDYVIVVDSSQSMVGERFVRAASLVSHLVSEMDRRDRFTLMACDATCQSMDSEPRHPSLQSAQAAREWLSELRPAGSSDLAYALRTASTSLSSERDPQRKVRVLYIGDGIATVGHRRAGAVAAQTADLSRDESVQITTVGIGADSDAMVLTAVARAGGGHYIPYVPGQRSTAAALAVLETTYGVSLRDARLELPEGVTDVAPGQDGSLPTIRSGEELIVAARFDGDVRGDVVLRGTVGGQPYEDRYPIHLTASTAAGNAFVPRLWASATIERLELEGRGAHRAQAVALSQAFGVMSRDTSLLVLESEAMFQAFGVDRVQHAPLWTGDEEMEEGESTGTVLHNSWNDRGGERRANEGSRAGKLLAKTLPSGRHNVRLTDSGGNGGPTLRPRGRVAVPGRTPAMGALDNSQIRSTMQRNISKIRRAYETSIRSNPNLNGRIAIQFTIGPDGRVNNAQVQSTSLNNTEVEQRIVSIIRGIRFPPTSGGSLTVIYPIFFQSASGGSAAPPATKTAPTTPAPTHDPAPPDLANDPAPPDLTALEPPERNRLAEQQAAPAEVRSDIRRMKVPPVALNRRGTGQWMRRVWERIASITADGSTRQREVRAVEEAEDALRQSPDSRDRHRDLVGALARAGELDRAREVAEQWITRDQLDPEALTALADILARQGARDEAVRILSGVVDLQPDNVTLHTQLATAFDRAGQAERACSHRLVVAELESRGDDLDAVGTAIRCARSIDRDDSARLLLDALENDDARQGAERAAGESSTQRVRGDLMIDADWTGAEDLDVSLITRHGKRISWMDGHRNVVGESSSATGRERLGLRWTPAGTYTIEVSRTSPEASGTVTGRLRVRALGEQRTIPFSLNGPRARIGRVVIRREQRMVGVR